MAVPFVCLLVFTELESHPVSVAYDYYFLAASHSLCAWMCVYLFAWHIIIEVFQNESKEVCW